MHIVSRWFSPRNLLMHMWHTFVNCINDTTGLGHAMMGRRRIRCFRISLKLYTNRKKLLQGVSTSLGYAWRILHTLINLSHLDKSYHIPRKTLHILTNYLYPLTNPYYLNKLFIPWQIKFSKCNSISLKYVSKNLTKLTCKTWMVVSGFIQPKSLIF